MDKEKVLGEVNDTVEAVEEVVEEVTETVEEVAEAVEEVAEKVRPEVYDDFSEEEPVAEEKAEKCSGFTKLVALTSAISTIATLIVLFVGSLAINFCGGLLTAGKIEGNWAYDMSYGTTEMKVYVFIEDGEMTLASSDGMEYFTCQYKVTEKDTIEIIADDETAAQMNGILSAGKMNVTYDKKNDAITFNPTIGGIATWTAITDEEKEIIDEKMANYVAPDYSQMYEEAVPEVQDATVSE